MDYIKTLPLSPPRCRSAPHQLPLATAVRTQNPDFRKEVKICEEFVQHRAQAHENLLTQRGTLLRMNRSIQVEGAFSILKSDRQFKRFLMRGKTNTSLELFLLCLAFDLNKCCSKLRQDRRKTHLFPLKKE